MIALSLLAEFSIKAAAIVLFGKLLSFAIRGRSAVWENTLWRLCLASVAILPLWMLARSFIPQAGFQQSIDSSGVAMTFSPSVEPLKVAVALHPQSLTVTAPSPETNWPFILVCVYGAGCVAFLGALLAAGLRLRRISKNSFRASLRFEGLPSHVVVRYTGELYVPVTFGMSTILLPNKACDWPGPRLGVAVSHELAHIRRRDWIWQMSAQLLRAVQWFNPALWLLLAELCRSAERAADDAVVSHGVERSTYAKELIQIASSCGPALQATVAMATKGSLKSRLHRLLSRNYEPLPASPVARYAPVTLAAGLAFLVCTAAIQISDSPTSASYGPGAPFYGPEKLSDGEEARIEYVEIPSRVRTANGLAPAPSVIWKPDGQPVDRSARSRALCFDTPDAPAGWRRLFVRISATDDEKGLDYAVHPKDWVVRVPYDSRVASYGTWGQPGGPSYNMAVIAVPTALKQTDVRVGIASGPWQEVDSASLGAGDLNPRIDANGYGKLSWLSQCDAHEPGDDIRDMQAARAAGITSGPVGPRVFAAAPDGRNLTFVKIDVPSRFDDKELFLEAFDRFGRTLPMSHQQDDVSGSGHYPNHTCVFVYACDPSDLNQFKLMARDYQIVTFKGVRCYPN